MAEIKPYWFEAKRYGWGWTLPVTWQGWAVVVAYFVAVGAGVAMLAGSVQWTYLLVVTVIFVAVVAWKGEKPLQWRWGGD